MIFYLLLLFWRKCPFSVGSCVLFLHFLLYLPFSYLFLSQDFGFAPCSLNLAPHSCGSGLFPAKLPGVLHFLSSSQLYFIAFYDHIALTLSSFFPRFLSFCFLSHFSIDCSDHWAVGVFRLVICYWIPLPLSVCWFGYQQAVHLSCAQCSPHLFHFSI